MFKTLKAHNGSFAKLGGLQVQPVTDDPSYDAKKQSTKPASTISIAPLQAHQATLNVAALQQSDGNLSAEPTTSLSKIANSLVSNPGFILPSLQSSANSILPSFATKLEPLAFVVPSASDNLVISTKKFEPYEQLTGISHERPEVVMMTNFLPLFSDDAKHSQQSFISRIETGGIYPFMTDAGRFVDTQVQIRALRAVNAVHLVRDVKVRYPRFGQRVSFKRTEFAKQLDLLGETSTFLLGLIKSLDLLKEQLDLRDGIYVIDTDRVVNRYVRGATRTRSRSSTTPSLLSRARRYIPPTYTLVDALVRLGYSEEMVRERFSSTKMWLQLLLELKDILRSHSHELLDVDPVTQRNDSSAASVTRSSIKHFRVRTRPVISLSELINTKPTAAAQTITTISQTFQSLYESVHFKSSEAQIAALLNLISKEFRYSWGLAKPVVQRSLIDHYGYTLNDVGNVGVFDSVIGRFGNSIADVPAIETNSLTNLAHRRPAENVAVLTFESKYVEGDSGTLTPGGSFYVDNVLSTDGSRFETSRLDSLGDLFEEAHKHFEIITDGMDLIVNRVNDLDDQANVRYDSILSDPVELAEQLLKSTIDLQSGNTLPHVAADSLGALFTYASKNNQIKSALFTYMMSRITRSYQDNILFLSSSPSSDNTPLTDALLEQLIRNLETAVPKTRAGVQALNSISAGTTFNVTRDALKAAVKAGTVTTRFFESTLGKILTSFRTNALVNNTTRYGAWQDTIVAMVAFDLLVNLVARFNNQNIVAVNQAQATKGSQGVTTFVVSKTVTNHKNSANELLTRIEREVTLVQKLIYGVMTVVQKLSNSIKERVNYLNGRAPTHKLQEIARLVNNPEMLQQLLSRQQVMMLASTIQDLRDRAVEKGAAPRSGDVDGDGDFDVDDEVKILDDAVPFPSLRNALYGLFNTPEFASRRGYNKKILTVGLPLGFVRRLKQRVQLSKLKRRGNQSLFDDKQSDVVRLVVYKIDLVNSDIVYKPKKFLFELSRFPVRNDARFLSLPQRPSIDDIVQAIPTRDFDQSHVSTNITYWNPPERSGRFSRIYKAAFDDESYSFLLSSQKAEIARNHVVSYLLEVYLRLLTGISVGDYHFDLVDMPRPVDSEFVKLTTEHRVQHLLTSLASAVTAAPVGGVLFSTTAPRKRGFVGESSNRSSLSSTGIVGDATLQQKLQSSTLPEIGQSIDQQRSPGSLEGNLAVVSHRNVPAFLHDFRTISSLTRMLTPLSSGLLLSKQLLMPKQFDRVFNVVVDPDEFEIDYEKTVATPHGKQALEQMLKLGEIIPAQENDRAKQIRHAAASVFLKGLRPFTQSRSAPNVNSYRYRDRDRNEGDLSFEKYFITIETFDEEGV